MKYNEALKVVQKKFKNHPKRLIHTLNVVEVSKKLALTYNLNLDEVKLASLFHDYSKYDNLLEHKKNMSNNDFNKYSDRPFIYHAISASNIIQTKYNIKNENIINSIRYHVYGRVNMSLFEKVILISDKIEKKRDYPLVEKIRKLSFINIDEAIYLFLKDNISYNQKNNFIINEEQIEVLKYFKKEKYENVKRNK